MADAAARATFGMNTRGCTGAEDGHAVLRRVFERTVEGLYRFILVRVGGNREVADDLLQHTCCEAARHRRPPTCADGCEAWLRGIARNLIRRRWRTLGRCPNTVSLENTESARRLVDDLEARPLPVEVLMREEVIGQLMLAVTALPAADQALIFAYYFDERPQAEIARDQGVTPRSIESRLYRVRGRLRAALRDERVW